MNEAGAIFEKLQTIAVDITHIFQPDDDEGLWKRYYDGDKQVFMRHVAKEMSRKQTSEIKIMYEEDTAFREDVADYMREFELILAKARNNERSDVLIAILTGSDAGRLYMVLARSLKN